MGKPTIPVPAAQMPPKRWPQSPRRWLFIGFAIDIVLFAATFCYQSKGHPEVGPVVNVLTVMSGVIVTAIITLSTVDHLNRQNQQRQWQRDATLETFSPVLFEVYDDIVKLGRLRPVSTEKWRAIAKDPRNVVLPAALWNNLASFYRELTDYEEDEYPASVEHGRQIANRTVFYRFKMRGYGASYQHFGGMGDAIQRDLPKVLDGDFQNLMTPDAMAAFRKSYDATVDEITKVESDPSYQYPPGAPFPSAEDVVKSIKQTVAGEKEVQSLLATQYSLRAKAEKVSEELRSELQRFYRPPLP